MRAAKLGYHYLPIGPTTSWLPSGLQVLDTPLLRNLATQPSIHVCRSEVLAFPFMLHHFLHSLAFVLVVFCDILSCLG